ncbi:hypothetical protein GOP80_08135 [Planococcaceae bacterium Storch 2/2-2]|nr:hypothetical protein [Planococcaceae bacterium Storch 2/2-2]
MEMKAKLRKVALASFLVWAGASTTADAKTFDDVPRNYTSYEAIDHLSDHEVIKGYSEKQFRPHVYVERQHIASTINRAIPLEFVREIRFFHDVHTTHRNYSDMMVLQRAGILNGYSNGYFRPTERVTRGQVAQILTRAFQLQPKGTHYTFHDVPRSNGVYYAVQALYTNDVFEPWKDGLFHPNEHVTRSEYAEMMYRAWKASKFPMTPEHEIKRLGKAYVEREPVERELKQITYQVIEKRNNFYRKNGRWGMLPIIQEVELIEYERDLVTDLYNRTAKKVYQRMTIVAEREFRKELKAHREKQQTEWHDYVSDFGGASATLHLQPKLTQQDRREIERWLDEYGY